jgi:hypothetical protein
MKKHFYSICTLILFAVLAISSKTNKLGLYAFNSAENVEEASPQGDYVEEKDGTRHYGKKIRWQSGLLLKDLVKIDDQKIKMSDVYGFRSGDAFRICHGTDFPQRVVRGKINVYKLVKDVSSYSTDSRGVGRWNYYTTTSYYAEVNHDGKLRELSKIEDIQGLVADCPAAAAMASLSNKEARKRVKKEPDFMNNIIQVYNRGCKS